MNQFFRFFLICASVLLCFSVFVTPVYADETKADLGDFGLRESANLGLLPGSEMVRTSPPTVQSAIGAVAGFALTFVGVLFLLLMIYAGFLWMTGSRGGKEGEINTAKKIMTWAIAGLAVIFLSYTIVSFIINIASQAPNPPPAAKTK